VTPPRPARLPPSPAPGVDVSARMSRTKPAGPVSVPPAGARRVMDEESRAWVDQLRRPGAERDAAVLALHRLLLSAARFEVNRRCATMPHMRGNDQADLAQQAADDALTAVLGKLEDFRGESRFTTWAYKFALFEAAGRLRRRAWQGREIPLEPQSWPVVPDRSPTPGHDLETRELLAAVGAAIDSVLSPHQREVLVTLAVNEVPIDVLAERLTTTRGALYKTLHDARRKLRSALIARGLRLDGSSAGDTP
jgi:RNA polymerase sigma-70 factor (ECF subfamily)